MECQITIELCRPFHTSELFVITEWDGKNIKTEKYHGFSTKRLIAINDIDEFLIWALMHKSKFHIYKTTDVKIVVWHECRYIRRLHWQN